MTRHAVNFPQNKVAISCLVDFFATQLAKEGVKFDTAILVFCWNKFFEHFLDIVFAQGLTKSFKDVLQLLKYHSAILHLVIKLENLHEVLIGSLVLIFLH